MDIIKNFSNDNKYLEKDDKQKIMMMVQQWCRNSIVFSNFCFCSLCHVVLVMMSVQSCFMYSLSVDKDVPLALVIMSVHSLISCIPNHI